MTPDQIAELAARLQKLADEMQRIGRTNADAHLVFDLRNASRLLLDQMAAREPFGYLVQTTTERNPPHGWAVHMLDGDIPIYLAPPEMDGPALNLYRQHTAGCEPSTPKERLRAFCSFAMRGQDWIDVEPFFDALPDDTALLRQALEFLERQNQDGWISADFEDEMRLLTAALRTRLEDKQ